MEHEDAYDVPPSLPPEQNVIHLLDHEGRETESENKLFFHFMQYNDMVYAIPSYEPGKTDVNDTEILDLTADEDIEPIKDHDYALQSLEQDDEIQVVEEEIVESVQDTEEAPKPAPKPKKTYTCKWCGETNTYYQLHRFHIRTYHQSGSLLCTQCGKSYKNLTLLRAHEKLIHQGIKKPAVKKCHICSKMFQNNFWLKIHLNRHMNIRTYECTQCNKKFFTGAALRGHRNVHTDEKSYQCPHCPMNYKYMTSLTRHLPKHDKTLTLMKHPKYIIDRYTRKEFKCDQCGKTFTLLEYLNYHLFNKHRLLADNFTPSHQCQVCQKAFSMPSHLKLHMYAHSEEKSFKCPYCPSTFRFPANLKLHVVLHNPKTQCPYCNKTFRTAKALNNHILNHTSNLPYRCMHCAKAFSASGPLKRHLRRTHKDFDTVIHDNSVVIESNIHVTASEIE